jgi:hypothetical protein
MDVNEWIAIAVLAVLVLLWLFVLPRMGLG